jgi:hypothetical protein
MEYQQDGPLRRPTRVLANVVPTQEEASTKTETSQKAEKSSEMTSMAERTTESTLESKTRESTSSPAETTATSIPATSETIPENTNANFKTTDQTVSSKQAVPITITYSNENSPTVITSSIISTGTATHSATPMPSLPVKSQGLSGAAVTGIVVASASVMVAILVVFLIRKWQLRVSIIY